MSHALPTHPRTRQIILADIVVTELLLANETDNSALAMRRICNAIQTAQEYEKIEILKNKY